MSRKRTSKSQGTAADLGITTIEPPPGYQQELMDSVADPAPHGSARVSLWNEDCIRGMEERLSDNSVHLTITSIPFEELFTYSGKLQDVGNNGSSVDVRRGRFALNMRFVIQQLYRVTAPGCNVCIHIQQLLAYKNQHGFMGRRDFRGAMIDTFREGGFLYTGEAAIPKDPQQMAQRLSLHSLQFKTGYARSSTNWAPAPNDFVLIFQKPGEAEFPVRPLRHETNPDGWMTTEDWIKWPRARGTTSCRPTSSRVGDRPARAMKRNTSARCNCP